MTSLETAATAQRLDLDALSGLTWPIVGELN